MKHAGIKRGSGQTREHSGVTHRLHGGNDSRDGIRKLAAAGCCGQSRATKAAAPRVCERLKAANRRLAPLPAAASTNSQAAAAINPLLQMVLNMWSARSVAAFARLGIADCIQNEPKSAETIAQELGLHAPLVFRLLRAAANAGVAAFDDSCNVSLTTVGHGLLSEPQSGMPTLRNFFIAITDPAHWSGWGDVEHAVRTGEPATPHVLGMELWEYYEEHQAEGKMFAQAMSDFSSASVPAVLQAYPFTDSARVVDYGGSEGAFLKAILAKYPNATGVLYDLPHVVESADVSEFGNRIMKVGGDYYKGPYPEIDADYYILKHILHAESDEGCVTILNNLRGIMRNRDARILIVELLVDESFHEGEPPNMPILMDVSMLVHNPGRERTADEYRRIFHEAGFELTRVMPTQSPMFVIEGMLA